MNDELRADADWLEENARGYWAEGNPVSPQCQQRLLRIAGRLRDVAAIVKRLTYYTPCEDCGYPCKGHEEGPQHSEQKASEKR